MLSCIKGPLRPFQSDKSISAACCLLPSIECPHSGGPEREGIALVPFADMLDHSHDRHMAWHTGASGKDPFTFISHTPIRKALP